MMVSKIRSERQRRCCTPGAMDDETAAMRRRIAEAHHVQKRLTQMQDRIRKQHDRLEHVIRGFDEEDRPQPEDLQDRLARLRRDSGGGRSRA